MNARRRTPSLTFRTDRHALCPVNSSSAGRVVVRRCRGRSSGRGGCLRPTAAPSPSHWTGARGDVSSARDHKDERAMILGVGAGVVLARGVFLLAAPPKKRGVLRRRRCAGPSSEPSTRFALGGGDREDRDGRGDSTLSCCERVEAKRHERQPATPQSWGICSISPSRARRRAGPHRSAVRPSNPSINNGRATHAPIRLTSAYPMPICCGSRRVAEARESLTAAQDGRWLL